MTTKPRLVAGAALLLAFAAAAAGAALETAAPSTVGVSAARLEQIGAALRAEVQQGAIPGGNSAEEFGTFIQAEIRKWDEVIRRNNITAD